MIQSIFISMPMFVCVFWALMLFLDGRTNGDPAKKMLCVFMSVATFLYLGHGFYFNRNLDVLPFTDTIYVLCNLAVFPLFYIYIEEMTEGKRNRGKRLLYLLPAILTSVVVAFFYIRMNHEESLLFIQNYLYHNESDVLTEGASMQASVHTFAKVIFSIQIAPVLFFGIRKINRYNRHVCGYYADTEDKTLTPFKHLLVLFFVISLISFVCNVIGRYRFVDSTTLLAIPSVTFSILLFCLGYIGYKQYFNVVNLKMEMGEQQPGDEWVRDEGVATARTNLSTSSVSVDDEGDLESNSVLNRREQTNIRIISTIKEEKLFLRHNLKISDIASFLHTNRDYIYHAINVEIGMSFSDFINQQRVEYAQQMIKENPEQLLYEVATNSGFSSNVTFYRCFKQFTGCSPKEYKEQLQ